MERLNSSSWVGDQMYLRMLDVHCCKFGMNELNWFARPMYERSSLMFLDGGKSLIA